MGQPVILQCINVSLLTTQAEKLVFSSGKRRGFCANNIKAQFV